MDFKFGKDSENSQSEGVTGEKKKQGSLLVLLLILVGGFAYIYFFTPLIKPLEVSQNQAPETPVTQPVKMPLPSREGDPGKPAEKTAATPEAAKTAAASSTAKAEPAATPVTTPPKPAPPVPKQQATAPAKAKEEPKKIEPAKPVATKPQPVVAAAKPAEKTIPSKADSKKSLAETVPKKAPVKESIKKAEAGAEAKVAAKTAKTAPESWSLILGNYVLEEAISTDMGRVRKAGLEPVVAPSIRKKTKMSRLFVTDYADRATAQTNLEKLKRHTSDAFVIEQGGRFALYAGSYLQSTAANSEKARLTAAGFPIAIRNTDIAIPTQSLTVGPFKEKKAADAALLKLRAAGIKATLTQK